MSRESQISVFEPNIQVLDQINSLVAPKIKGNPSLEASLGRLTGNFTRTYGEFQTWTARQVGINGIKTYITQTEIDVETARELAEKTRTNLPLVSHRFHSLLHSADSGRMPLWMRLYRRIHFKHQATPNPLVEPREKEAKRAKEVYDHTKSSEGRAALAIPQLKTTLFETRNQLARDIWERAVVGDKDAAREYAGLAPDRAEEFAKKYAAAHKDEDEWTKQKGDFKKVLGPAFLKHFTPGAIEKRWEEYVAKKVLEMWRVEATSEAQVEANKEEIELKPETEPTLSGFELKKLGLTLWAEKVLKESLAGAPAPWYAKRRTVMPTLATLALGVLMIGRVPTPGDAVYELRYPRISVCSDPNRFININDIKTSSTNIFEPSIAFAAPLEGGPTIITSPSNLIATNGEIAIYNGTYLDIEVNLPALREALRIRGGRELLPFNIQSYFMLLSETNSGLISPSGFQYADTLKGMVSSLIFEKQMLQHDQMPSAPSVKGFVEPVLLWDTAQKAALKYGPFRTNAEFRQAFSTQLGEELSDAALTGMRKLGLIEGNFPYLSVQETRNLALAIHINTIHPTFLTQACQYGSASAPS